MNKRHILVLKETILAHTVDGVLFCSMAGFFSSASLSLECLSSTTALKNTRYLRFI